MKSANLQLFLSRSLEKILSEREIKKSYHSQLKTSCETVLEELKNGSVIEDKSSNSSSALPLPQTSTPENIPEGYFLPFEIACSSRSPKIICTALDCLQKLIAYGHLNNNVNINEGANSTTNLINRLVESICSCFNGPSTDEGVQLQIIKALLTIVTSPHISIHEGTVLLTIRTVYNIYLASKSPINSTTAKGTLSQMLNVIYTRMESEENVHVDNNVQNTPESKIANGELVSAVEKIVGNEKESIIQMNGEIYDHIDHEESSLHSPSPLFLENENNGSISTIESETILQEPNENEDSASLNSLKNETKDNNVEEKSDSLSGESDKSSKEDEENFVKKEETHENEAKNSDSTLVNDVKNENKETEAKVTGIDSQKEEEKLEILEKSEKMDDLGEEEPESLVDPQNPFEELDNYEEADDEIRREIQSKSDKNKSLESGESGGRASADSQVKIEPESQLSASSRIPSEESLSTPTESGSYVLPNTVSGSVPSFNHVLQKDAFLIFRALCKLSMKPLPENTSGDSKSHELRSKILSLQLLLSVVSDPGHVFKTNPIFITAIKQYLCVSLNKNGLSPVPEVFELSLKIFVQLLVHFRTHLRTQIEVFFKDVIFSLLESSSPHKSLTLSALLSFSSSAQIIVDLYLNYDCDMGSVNIFERLVNALSRIGTDSSETGLRVDGIRGLVGILQCMDEWSRPKETLEEVVEDNPVQFEVMKLHKNTWEQGLFLFNRKPSEGLKFLQSNNLLGQSAEEIAIFFHTDDRIDKVGIGEYLGDPDVFHKQVMYAYVDQFNFKDQDFVTGLRHFLQGFRLPGEAQKIDRLMEKFASRYCECNPNNGIFTSADTAYVLAYSIIMLTTDLHSKNVKTKMTKEQYIKMNRGINDSRDLPESYLSGIYDEISQNEIKMKNVSKKSLGKSLVGSITKEQNFTEGKHLEHIRPMFKLAWTPFLASFSVGLQDSNEPNISSLCLNGMRLAIHIACIFYMRLERDAYIQALARFTLLNTSSLTEMKSKNINSIKTLISIGQLEGNYLDTSWLDILKVISSLELAQLVGTRSRDGSNHAPHVLRNWSSTDSSNPLLINLNHLDPSVKESITSTSSQSILVAVDRIFTGSTLLDGDSIVHFVRALCTVSLDELTSSHPRMFSLQKIVEISYYNMSRIRLQWSRIWEVLGDHFNHVGCLNDEIAFFAIDSLRQLSMKFIEKGEFTNFRFQKDFLRPFEYIMKKNKNFIYYISQFHLQLHDIYSIFLTLSSPSIRDMIVRCIAQMIHQSSKIRSGWKNIFSVLSIGANDIDPNIVEMCFNTTNKIIGELYTSNPTMLTDSFQDGIKCLSEFACNTNYPDISMESIRLIRFCGNFVDQKPELLTECMDELNIPCSDRIWVRGWFPILFELSCIISRCNLDVRTRGLTVMFEIIKTYGSSFQPHWWKDLFQVIFRIFDNMKLPEQLNEKTEWMTTTCNHALFAIIDVFTQYYDILGPLLMDDLFKQLQWCIEGGMQDPTCQLSISAVHCFEHLVLSNGSKFDANVWKITVEFLKGIGEWMSQNVLYKSNNKKSTPSNQSPIPKELILTIDNIVFYQSNPNSENSSECHDYETEQGMYPYLSNEDLICILETLEYFNKDSTSPLLESLSTTLRLLFRIYNDSERGQIHAQTEAQLINFNKMIMAHPEWTSLLSLSLQRTSQLPSDKFKIHTSTYYPLLCDLISVEMDPELKKHLKNYFIRIGATYI